MTSRVNICCAAILARLCLALALLVGVSHQVRIVDRRPSLMGGWIELLQDADPHFQQRQFLPSQHQRNPEIVAVFGSETPASGSALLHYAGSPPAGVAVHSVPVILVPGAKVDGSFFFRSSQGQSLAENLKGRGFQVYAITFAHNQDDNFVQAQQVANVAWRVRALTGSPVVDLVAHSKGCIPATVYATPGFRQQWMSDYGGDVRRLMLLGGPNGGIDYFFRHPFQDQGASNWPMVWNTVTVDGAPSDCSQFQMGPQGYWPGQAQLVARWDDRYPLPEWDQRSRKSYYGGSTEQFQADGIEQIIDRGGRFMEKLQASPLGDGVEVGLLAGNHADVPGFNNETAGPSDGIILVESAVQAPKDARVTSSHVLPCNHLELVLGAPAQQIVGDFLASP